MTAATCDVHGAGDVTDGRDVTSTAGCHGGGAGGSGGCGGTGQPASATGLDVSGGAGADGDGGFVVWLGGRAGAADVARGEEAEGLM